MGESDFSGPFIIGYGSSPCRCRPAHGAAGQTRDGSQARSVRACQVLRPRRVAQVLALTHVDMLPSATQTASAPGNSFLSRLNGWPARTPTEASRASSRMRAHCSGPMWFAIPSSQWTSTTYSLPVSRRTCVETPPALQYAEHPRHEDHRHRRAQVGVGQHDAGAGPGAPNRGPERRFSRLGVPGQAQPCDMSSMCRCIAALTRESSPEIARSS